MRHIYVADVCYVGGQIAEKPMAQCVQTFNDHNKATAKKQTEQEKKHTTNSNMRSIEINITTHIEIGHFDWAAKNKLITIARKQMHSNSMSIIHTWPLLFLMSTVSGDTILHHLIFLLVLFAFSVIRSPYEDRRPWVACSVKQGNLNKSNASFLTIAKYEFASHPKCRWNTILIDNNSCYNPQQC